MLQKRMTLVALLTALSVLLTAGSAHTQQGAVPVAVEVGNTNCDGNVQIAQFIFLRNQQSISVNLRVPPAQVGPGSTQTFEFELNQEPTAVNLRGTLPRQSPLDVTAQMGTTTQYECGVIRARIAGQGIDEPTTPGGSGQGPQVPPELGGISQGMTPSQVLQRLQLNGFQTTVQGNQAQPKVAGADDLLITAALGPGLTARGTFVSTPAGQLSSAVVWDQPSNPLILLVVSDVGGFCLSLPPGTGLTVFCDRAGALAPATTIGGGPVPGNVFLVITLKLGGGTTPFVLSLR